VTGLVRDHRAATAAACIAALAFTFSIVSPALGGPSIRSIAKTAKKALSTARTANNRALDARDLARGAQDTADRAGRTAGDATNKANAALARGHITVVSSAQVPYGPSDLVQSAIATCPAGQQVISGGGVNIGDQELAATEPVGRDGWGVIGVDLVDDGGEYVQAYALCAPAGVAVAAGTPAKARRDFGRLARRIGAESRR
jgi:hypothetical protein